MNNNNTIDMTSMDATNMTSMNATNMTLMDATNMTSMNATNMTCNLTLEALQTPDLSFCVCDLSSGAAPLNVSGNTE